MAPPDSKHDTWGAMLFTFLTTSSPHLQRETRGRKHHFRACAKAADQRKEYSVRLKDYIHISVSNILDENSLDSIWKSQKSIWTLLWNTYYHIRYSGTREKSSSIGIFHQESCLPWNIYATTAKTTVWKCIFPISLADLILWRSGHLTHSNCEMLLRISP